MPPPSAMIVVALFTDFDFIAGRTSATPWWSCSSATCIGPRIGLILAAVITQFPFVGEDRRALYPDAGDDADAGAGAAADPAFRLRLRTAIIAVALASGPMVMINAATGFRRVDLAKIALARSFGASTLQIFVKIRVPMALPMIIVGLMIGAIFGLLTAVGAEMVGGGFGLGNRLTYILGDAENAAVLRRHPDPVDARHSDLRHLLPDRQEVGELGILN